MPAFRLDREVDMGIFDSMLAEIDCELNAVAISEQLGIPVRKVEQAIAALAAAHSQQGNTVEAAAASSGLSRQQIAEIIDQLGGEVALDKLSGLLGKGPRRNPLTDRLSDLYSDS
jgi:hypothetical protein